MFNFYARASLIWAIVSAGAISIPGSMLPRITGTTNFIVDNTSHILIFMVLALLMTKSFLTRNPPLIRWKAMIYAGSISVIYGFSLEIVQIPIPDRAFEWSDGIANAIGATIGVLIAGFWKTKPDKKQ